MHRAFVVAAFACSLAIASAQNAPTANAQMPGSPMMAPTPMIPGAVGTGYNGVGPRAYGQAWGSTAANTDWDRFYHYPYVYYPQNFWSQDYYKSSDSLYHRYPTEMRIPVYNKRWHNYYPSNRRFHMGHHFILDTF